MSSSPTANVLTDQQPVAMPAMSFRPHHNQEQQQLPHPRAHQLTHTQSFSSLSSYASSVGSDSEAPKNGSTTRQRKEKRRPGAGTTLRPAGKAHDWYSGGRITSNGRWFRDAQNRTLMLRGVNLCGNSKLPTTPNGSSHLSEGFFNHRDVCFLGRPFPRDQADEHFSRLKRWGLTFVRLLVPWEALEHSGPGIYDEKFIESLIELIELMPTYGIKCFIDPHQDCWSRFSGGSGAPGWTFEAAGLDLTKFKTTGAAYVHNTNQFPGDSPPMVWPTNYTKLAASTMFTLFWAGDTFAPNKMYQGEPIQQFLQSRYLNCYQHLARRLSHLDAVIGFEVMNEPHPGYIGLENLRKYDFNSNLVFGDFPSALESFGLGDGMTLPIDVWVKSWPFPTKKQRTRMINTERDSAWIDGECLWKQHGVWSVNAKSGKPQVDKPDYFTKHPITGEKIDFERFYLDFVGKYSRAIQSVIPSAFVFVEPVPNEPAPVWQEEDHHENIVYAPHWYDLHSLFNKAFDGRITHDVQGLSKGKNVFSATYFGIKGARKNYKGQIANILNTGLQNVGNKPCLIGECGIPMDINQRQAFMSGDYGHHSKFLDAVLGSLEANLLSFTLWNYNATNDNTHGDHWNGEDFSIFSLDSPQGTPESYRSGSPCSEARMTLRQQSPSFAREVMKRAATASGDVSEKLYIRQPGQIDTTGMSEILIEVNDQPYVDETKEENDDGYRSSDEQEVEDETVMDDSPFDRSYFRFENEDSDDGRNSPAHIGGRALDAVVRPYAAKVAGEPILTEFHLSTLQFTFRFCNYVQTSVPTFQISEPESERPESTSSDSTVHSLRVGPYLRPEMNGSWVGHPPEDAMIAFETEIFVPSYHYDETGLEILVSDGDWRYVKERQTLYYRHSDMRPGAVHSVQIKPLKGASAAAAGLSPGQGNNNGSSLTSLSNPSSLSLRRMQSAESTKSASGRAVGRIGHEPLEPSKLKIEEVYGGHEARVRAESEAGCLCAIM
ncbi:endoglycosylceramidase [Entomortierella parvispora]|uniref:Endoglycosylceramidase n=1 Tax=Entomortierella parvispora TaxID=205924 RepID=A0A9P3M036_9FUNG|nr:endoglycosylceramidase [Entomortierella parvispora]